MAIKLYSDHAANERTFLAWVRTSIAVIAFGFLVERFDLFLSYALPQAGAGKITVPRSEFGQLAGLVLIIVGIVMIVLAALRFYRTAKEIDDAVEHPGTGSRIDLALAGLLALLGVALLFYLWHTLAAQA